jgi:hypothetical protein
MFGKTPPSGGGWLAADSPQGNASNSDSIKINGQFFRRITPIFLSYFALITEKSHLWVEINLRSSLSVLVK